MKIKLLLFAGVAEAVGAREVVVELTEGMCVADAWDLVSGGWPVDAQRAAAGAAFAVNEAYVRAEECVLCEGDVLAVIGPVSGG